MIVELRHVYKNYLQGKLEVPVLRDINFAMEEGEYVAIMGPSGSGKSTLMNIIGCLDQATSGEFFIDGRDVSKCSDNEMADVRLQKIGFIFQNFQLLPYETALENVALPLSYANVPARVRRERAAEALKRVGLGERMNFTPLQLSGGQKQRVAIARAMINNPKILLADEPTGALDQASGRAVMELFSQLNKEGVTVLMITHDANIAAHAKRIVEIWDGELRYPGGEAETFSSRTAEEDTVKKNAAKKSLADTEVGMLQEAAAGISVDEALNAAEATDREVRNDAETAEDTMESLAEEFAAVNEVLEDTEVRK